MEEQLTCSSKEGGEGGRRTFVRRGIRATPRGTLNARGVVSIIPNSGNNGWAKFRG